MTAPIKRLSNSYERNLDQVHDPFERMRIARNDRYVAILEGGRGPNIRGLRRRYRLTVDQALEVLGRDRSGRKTDGRK